MSFSTSKLLTVLFLAFAVENANSFNITLYYEALCDDSQHFIITQLYPNYKELLKNVTITFVPFGNARATEVDGAWEFECQHGPQECYGNKFQSCAVEIYPQDTHVEFINCVMHNALQAGDDNVMEPCATQAGFWFGTLRTCYNAGLGDELLARNGQISGELVPKLSYVPTIVFNGVFSADVQAVAEFDLLTAVCAAWKEEDDGPLPESCREKK